MLPLALMAYCTSILTSTGATPYSLVYRMEVVIPVEAEILSLRILIESELEEAEMGTRKARTTMSDRRKAPNRFMSRSMLPKEDSLSLQQEGPTSAFQGR